MRKIQCDSCSCTLGYSDIPDIGIMLCEDCWLEQVNEEMNNQLLIDDSSQIEIDEC